MPKHLIYLTFAAIVGLAGVVSAGTYSGGGNGTAEQPYRISTPADMNNIGNHIEDFNKCFVLVNDINLAEYTGTEFSIIGNEINPFTGVFDGNGHTISNFSYTTVNTNYIGLFGYVNDADVLIKDLTLVTPDVNAAGASDCISGLVGCLQNGTITGCGVDGGSITGRFHTGGLVGYSYKGTISNCYATGSVSGRWMTGGLVGTNYECGTISNSWGTGSVSGGNDTGGLVGYNSDGIISNCYATGSVTGDSYTGGLVGRNSGTIRASFWDIEVGGPDNGIGTPLLTSQMQTMSTFTDAGWDFVSETANGTNQIWQMPTGGGYPALSSFRDYLPPELSGDGTSDHPYLIGDANELGAMYHYDSDANYRLEADIDLTGISWFTAPIPVFYGCFDGNGHTITGLHTEGGGCLGLFGYVGTGAAIKHLTLVTPYVNAVGDSRSVGGLVGYLRSGRISGCGIEGGSVSGKRFTGGLVGENDSGTISNCYASGSVTGDRSTGGLVGDNSSGTISNCYAIASVSGYDYDTGGLVGENDNGTIDNCYAIGSVSGTTCTGGLVGYNRYGTISNCYATSSVMGTNNYTGGLVGYNYGAISNCYAASIVDGNNFVGGLIGYDYENTGDYTKSFWDKEVNPDVNGIGNASDPNVIGESTINMQTESTFTDAGWDFIDETTNGIEDIWRLCEDGTDYPRLAWQFIMLGDFICGDGVDFDDLDVFMQQWLMEKLSADVAVGGGDGIVDFLDWAVLADRWQNTIDINDVADFANQWLQFGAYCADIAPSPAGDGVVDMLDFAVLADNWLKGL